MNIDEVTLLAYVDQSLPEAQRVQVDIALNQSAELRAQLAALEASRLPYGTAFSQQALPEMPASLVEKLDALTKGANSHSSQIQQAQNPTVAPNRHHYFAWGLGLAASFVLGWGLNAWLAVPSNSSANSWVEAVANYQAMYTRATVSQASQTQAEANAVLAEFSVADRVLSIPELRADGFEFKRAQQLAFGDQPLLQIAYLPLQGKPTALCVLKRNAMNKESATAKVQQLHGLNVVTWTKGAHAFALATELPRDAALAIGNRLANAQL